MSFVSRSVSWCIYITNDTECHREAVTITHECQLKLEGVVLAMSIVYQNVLLRDAVLANLHHFQAKTFLYKTKLIVLTEDKGFAVLHIDGVLGASFFAIDSIVGAIVEDNTVLQNLAYGCTLVVIGRLEDFHGTRSMGLPPFRKDWTSTQIHVEK